MAFRRPFRRFRRRTMRRKSPYELKTINVCRAAVSTGLSDCETPDIFIAVLYSPRLEYSASVLSGGGFTNPTNPLPIAKGTVLRGIHFDYQYSYVPQEVSNPAIGVTTIRSAIIAAPIAQNSFSNPDADLGVFPWLSNINANEPLEELRKKYRVLWRGLDVMSTNLLDTANFTLPNVAASTTPRNQMTHRHVDVKSAVALDMNHALYWYAELVNPFLEDNPTLAFDLLGYLAERPMRTGNRYA